ncbi:heme exporter protein CcmD [Actibacterium ureilyticum]|uniref:heme exporter protein CcmD n=1 Tax=Actibacterium ureilyticum TaxID=1590614 RepID=UPI000BAB2344|nr:heme exporter protein CcmD [Actibacterium ureilyticum]
MIPDLGKYAFTVLMSYGASLGLLAVLIGLSLRRGARVRRALEDVESRRREDG